jgi:putative ABC transport system permease protein
MLSIYIKMFYRQTCKQSHTFINILGLAIGLASFILIVLYVVDELSYDRYHKNSENIYRLVNVYNFEGVGENSASSPFPLAFTLKDEYPGMIENTVRVFNFQSPRLLIEYDEQSFNERRFFYADSTFFDVFDHEFIYGDPETALDESYSVVITESTAEKYFGDENPIGKLFRFEKKFDLKVTGVVKNIPSQSHFKFDFIGSMSSVAQLYGGKLPKTWVWNPCWTYFLLQTDADPKELENEFPSFIEKFFYDAEKENVSLYLQALTDIHLKSKLDYEIEANNNYSYIRILSIIALFLLIIAAINFTNLATAASDCRIKEIGVKKILGVSRKRLIFQFLSEAIILSFISLIFALLIIELILPAFNIFTGKEFSTTIFFQTEYLLGILFLGFLTGFISGIYPAFYLSSLKPLSILYSGLLKNNKKGLLRKILVIIQFAVSITLIVVTLFIFRQATYLRNAKLGFNKENIVVVPVNHTNVANSYESFKKELLQNPNILSVTNMDDILGSAHNTHEFRPEGFPLDKWQFYPALVIGYDFIKTFEIEIVEGRDYLRKNKTDPEKGILINEAMVKHVGWENNKEAIGKKFRSLSGDEKVIGVFKDFNVTSLHEPAGPFVLNMKEKEFEILWFLKYLAIRISPENSNETIDFIEKKCKEFSPERPFEYSFLDNELDELYSDEENLAKLTLIFTILIIFIASLGLFGLTSFTVARRTKEIGIRKTLGSGTVSIIALFSKEFIQLILISIVIAWPVSYFLIDNWLQYFAYQASINWFIFIIAGFLAVIVAMLITSIKGFFASRINPVETLKYE